MTPLTAAQVAEARRSWRAALKLDLKPSSQALAIALWASVWAELLLAAAEVLTSLQEAVRVPKMSAARAMELERLFPPQSELDPDT